MQVVCSVFSALASFFSLQHNRSSSSSTAPLLSGADARGVLERVWPHLFLQLTHPKAPIQQGAIALLNRITKEFR
jgi:hypothetical protein